MRIPDEDQDDWPTGHREGSRAGDDDVREAGENAEEATMEQERDASKVDEPVGEPPDKDLAFDPTMTDTDEANIPPDSDADPTSEAPDEGR